MKNIKEVVVDGNLIFLKKSKERYRVIYPIKIDGEINWKNLISGGNWWNLLIIFFIVFVILGCIWEYSVAKRVAEECLNKLSLFGMK